MTRRLRLSDQAEHSLRSIAIAIAEAAGDRATASRFAERLREKCVTLAALPGASGRARPELGADFRSYVFKNHVIFFRYVDDAFEIVDIVDGRRDIDAYFSTD
ncbi:type II toxin-antitoxin system RelE/ParE family toxin [Chelatococcus sambhunathii]|uniref:Type II toxin-antitoxin system RelE/ParE family toxin n=1 Tax=Chelatococcus sambhunathii TaxID=363953 RepID=A0ABU1DHF1_9HYPH|nr:type II toxin-antitoxin system RelE/ParE family toxin [Chelatococcus sambhunathii]MDR4307545.1 type II toxin-antitoxin system RelE/ParE family toxin [Chelatococcus sambhunathii]